jgi:hypothetical protein
MSPSTLIQIQEVTARPPGPKRGADATRSGWTSLFRIGGVAAAAIVALIPLQAAIYILWPPPTTVLDYFSIFQSNVLLGLLDLDLLLIVDQLLVVAVLLGLFAALRQTDESIMLVGTTFGLIGALLFVVSREATFSMFWLSQHHSVANSETERAALVAAGQTLLTTYNGTSFSIGYMLSGLAMLLVSVVMLRSSVFSRATGWAGVIAGVTGLVPASFGTLGFVLSFISLLPLVVWLALIARRFFELARVSDAGGDFGFGLGRPM